MAEKTLSLILPGCQNLTTVTSNGFSQTTKRTILNIRLLDHARYVAKWTAGALYDEVNQTQPHLQFIINISLPNI